jgi:hypothetical protein
MTWVRWLVAFWCVCVAAAAASCTTKSRPSQLVPLTRMPAHPLAFRIFRLRNGPGRVCRTRILDAEYRNANTHESIAALTVSTHLAGATAFWLARVVGRAMLLGARCHPRGTGAQDRGSGQWCANRSGRHHDMRHGRRKQGVALSTTGTRARRAEADLDARGVPYH